MRMNENNGLYDKCGVEVDGGGWRWLDAALSSLMGRTLESSGGT